MIKLNYCFLPGGKSVYVRSIRNVMSTDELEKYIQKHTGCSEKVADWAVGILRAAGSPHVIDVSGNGSTITVWVPGHDGNPPHWYDIGDTGRILYTNEFDSIVSAINSAGKALLEMVENLKKMEEKEVEL